MKFKTYNTLSELYERDSTILDGITLPDGYVAGLFKRILLQDYSDRLCLYSETTIKSAIIVWCDKYQDSMERIYNAITEQYDPLHNFDRHEVYSDIENIDSDNETKNIGTTNSETNGTSENTISADNESEYSPDNKNISSASDTTSIDSKTTGNIVTDRELNHSGHLYGNIGVTKSQDMLQDEVNIRMLYSLYIPICELFANDLLLGLSDE